MKMLHEQTILRKVQRFSVHGIILDKGKLLLITEKRGPYAGKLNFPGGGIEFGEAPEETLRRELQEEVGVSFEKCNLLDNLANTIEVMKPSDPFIFHHVDMIYNVEGYRFIEDAQPEEKFSWYTLKELHVETLAPFAKIM